MLIERMRKRLSADRASFIEPCLPSPADKPPSGSNWDSRDKARRLPAQGPSRSGLYSRSDPLQAGLFPGHPARSVWTIGADAKQWKSVGVGWDHL